MNLYTVDYPFYREVYGGTEIPEAVFPPFVRRALVLLGNMIRSESEALDAEKVKLLLCEICDNLYREDGRRGISRESLDGYDVSYCDEASTEIRQAVRRHLGDFGVLYRGRRL